MRYLVPTEESAKAAANEATANEANNTNPPLLSIKKHARECDFYRNPTILSRLILHQKFQSARQRLRTTPLEACTWVVSLRQCDEEEEVTHPEHYDKTATDNHQNGSTRRAMNHTNDLKHPLEEQQQEQQHQDEHVSNPSSADTSTSSSFFPSLVQQQTSVSGLTSDGDSSSDGTNKVHRIFAPPAPAPLLHPYAVRPSEIQFLPRTCPNAKQVPGNEQGHKDDASNYYYSFRQLPIHMACQSLSQLSQTFTGPTCNNKLQKQQQEHLERLIGQLVVVHAQGCSQRDHTEQLPLHYALLASARNPKSVSMDTLVLLLMAFPAAAQPDQTTCQGQTALEFYQEQAFLYNVSKQDQQKVVQLLQRKETFWKLAQTEANLRLKHNNHRPKQVGAETASIDSTSVLFDSMAEEYTLVTTKEEQQPSSSSAVWGNPGGRMPQRGHTTNKPNLVQDCLEHSPTHPRRRSRQSQHSPTEWSQLEKRVWHLEKLLAERLEQNYQLQQEVQRLQTVEDDFQQWTSTTFLPSQVLKLEKEKAQLQQELYQQTVLLQRNGILVPEKKAEGNNNNDDDDDETSRCSSVKPLQVTVVHEDETKEPDSTKAVWVDGETAEQRAERLEQENRALVMQVEQLTVPTLYYQNQLACYKGQTDQHQPSKACCPKQEASCNEETSKNNKEDMVSENIFNNYSHDPEQCQHSTSSSQTTPNANNVSGDSGNAADGGDGDDDSNLSPESMTLQSNLDGLLEMAEKLYGHSFSKEMVEAWQSTTAVPQMNMVTAIQEFSHTTLEDILEENESLEES